MRGRVEWDEGQWRCSLHQFRGSCGKGSTDRLQQADQRRPEYDAPEYDAGDWIAKQEMGGAGVARADAGGAGHRRMDGTRLGRGTAAVATGDAAAGDTGQGSPQRV